MEKNKSIKLVFLVHGNCFFIRLPVNKIIVDLILAQCTDVRPIGF